MAPTRPCWRLLAYHGDVLAMRWRRAGVSWLVLAARGLVMSGNGRPLKTLTLAVRARRSPGTVTAGRSVTPRRSGQTARPDKASQPARPIRASQPITLAERQWLATRDDAIERGHRAFRVARMNGMPSATLELEC